ncbi:class I SAM-dependent DNA methyltransferase [Kibdelosporangium aridum]|uniref:class I SAM-dependent DNA methyltransferase n=1 Tax=Kibdelosporangium aridum TaxID=2030 RepID=UPI000526C9D9
MRGLPKIYSKAEIYDAIYEGRGGQARQESIRLAGQIARRNGRASSLLDVACGTGSHLEHLAGMFDRVEGLDLSEQMLEKARKRLPSVPVHCGDMRDFTLGTTFDAVICMFSSVGYLADCDELDSAMASFARHLNPGGVIVVEPWWFPPYAKSGDVVADVVTVDGRTISRTSYADWIGSAHHIKVHYVLAERGVGIRHFTDTHVLRVFQREEYEAAFTRAHCTVEYLPGDPSCPGWFIGIRTG